MLDAFWRMTQNLFSYQEFRALVSLFQASLWVMILIILVFVVMHVLYMLGYQTPLYKKRSPRAHWNKRFFRSAFLMSLLILAVLTGAEWIEKNVPRTEKPQTVFKQLLPALKRL